VRGAFGDPDRLPDLAQADARVMRDAEQQQLDADNGGNVQAAPVPSAPTADDGNAPEHTPATLRAEQCHCLCGHAFQVFGLGRHRRYYELADLDWRDPLMTRVCPSCQCPLPAESTRRATPRA
jgi:hypothetical protein